MTAPLVSVVLPCFDAARYLPAALDSLLVQGYPALEIVAVDDGSRDDTARILAEYAAKDRRVRVVTNPSNLGLIETLNRGIAEARGELIARMDADDVAARHRIERQVNALLRRSDVDVIGSGVVRVADDGRRLRPAPVRCREPGGARFMALFATPIAHPTLLARTVSMRAHLYGGSQHSLHTEDYELFTRMLAAGVGLMNIDEPLVRARVHREGVSVRHERIQIENFVESSRRYLEKTLGVVPAPGTHRVLVNRIDAATAASDLVDGLRWLDRLEAEFVDREPAAADEIRRIADEQRADILIQATRKGAPSARRTTPRLAVRYGRRLLSPGAMRYVVGKVHR